MKDRGFWRECFSRDNSIVDSMVVVSLIITGPFAALALVSLAYDIFWLGYGLTEVSVKLFSVMVVAGAAGLGVSRFSRRTMTEMAGRVIGDGPGSKPQGE